MDPSGQSNKNTGNYNNNTHSNEQRITQNVNIYVDTRNPNNNSNESRNNQNSSDPENPEIKTSKSRPILQSTPINVVRKRPTALESPRKSTEQHLPLDTPDRPFEEIDRNLSSSLISQKTFRQKLIGISKGHSCGDDDTSLKMINHQRNEDNESLGDASPKRLGKLSADLEKFCRSVPVNTWQEHKTSKSYSRKGSGTMSIAQNYAKVRKFISAKN